MVWAQAMPFVALWVYKRRESGDIDDIEEGMWKIDDSVNVTITSRTFLPDNGVKLETSTISTLLSCSFALWALTNAAFFYTINLSFLNTFYGSETGAECCVAGYQDCSTDSGRFAWAFGARMSYTRAIHGEVKTWVEENVDKWREENEDWFQADKIPDEFLPARVQLTEGGASRRRSSGVSFKEVTELVGREKLKREED